MLRYLTAGESHGPALTAILEGLPAGVPLSSKLINLELKRRQGGYGRGGRMKIESDEVVIQSGVRFGKTLGSPVTLQIFNKDWKNWTEIMSVEGAPVGKRQVVQPRPGHADLSGGLKYDHHDLRNVLERASARETAMRVAVGSVAQQLLATFEIELVSFVRSIGTVTAVGEPPAWESLKKKVLGSECATYDTKAEAAMKTLIDQARKSGDSLGGVFEVWVRGVPPGLGSHVQWDRKLDARLAMAIMSIQAVKGVEIGLGFEEARRFGSEAHDEILYSRKQGFHHRTNRAGGITGGMSNGEPIVVRGALKPISTLYKPLASVDITTKKATQASIERSDTCAVPAAGVIAQAVTAFEVANVFLEKFGGDSLREISRNYEGYRNQVASY